VLIQELFLAASKKKYVTFDIILRLKLKQAESKMLKFAEKSKKGSSYLSKCVQWTFHKREQQQHQAVKPDVLSKTN